nr:MAG TPA: hypothetical protein [Caudoviricetes sp.]
MCFLSVCTLSRWSRFRLPWYRESPSIAPCGAEKRGKKKTPAEFNRMTLGLTN